MKPAFRRPPLRKLLPWALLCVPLVFAARAATDYNAVPSGTPGSRLLVDPAAEPTGEWASNAAGPSTGSAQQPVVSARTLLKLTTSLSALPNQDGAERRLLHAYAEVAAGHLDAARAQAEQLARDYPHFSLAQLLLGDVMQASAGNPAGFAAAAPPALSEQHAQQHARILELRAEALARLAAYTAPPPTGAIAANLVALAPDVQRAIVVDTARSRLYLFEQRNGVPQLEASYYFSQGKLGAGKTQVGDMKTPLGIYFITRKIGAKDLKPLYGAGALTLNYPNEWDKQQGHTGFGVWLHGTPPGSYARVPLASDGCVVLSNTDLDALSKNLQIGLTPVIISNSVEWLSFDDWQSERSALNKKIEEWRADWESRDVERYLKHYSPKFQSKEANFEQFASQKRKVNAGKSWVKVKLSNLSMFRNPGAEELVVTIFEQDYQSNNLNNQMKKRQYWIREDGQWKIVYEGAA